MKNPIRFFKLLFALLTILMAFVACDKEFNEIESTVLDGDNINLSTEKIELPIIAYNKKLDSLQIDNLKAYLLGYYNDPNFGETTASIVTQLTPNTFAPNFGTDPSIDSVILKIPYYNKINTTNDFTINDTPFGDEFNDKKPGTFKLSIYQTKYHLNYDQSTNYYAQSNDKSNGTLLDDKSIDAIDFDNAILKADPLKLDNGKNPSTPIVSLQITPEGNSSINGTTPSLYYKLEPNFWKSLIFQKEDGDELKNADNFRDYFKGLYFKAESNTSNSMILLNLDSKDANITIYYKSNDSTNQSTYVLNFTGTRVNTFYNQNFKVLPTIDKTNGNEKLYLKGTNGSMAVIDLFKNDDDLKAFYDKYRKSDGNGKYLKGSDGNYLLKKLINDAQLIIYEDEKLFDKDAHIYDRIYAYNVIDNTATADYLLDTSHNLQSPFNSKLISLGRRTIDNNGNYKYKIRLTEHLKNLLLTDDKTPNTKIGLVLSTNVNLTGHSKILNSTDEVKEVPSAALITPRGTVIYGNNSSSDKRMRLEIFVTESK